MSSRDRGKRAVDKGVQEKYVFEVMCIRDLKQQPQNSSHQGGTKCPAHPIARHLVPCPEGSSPLSVLPGILGSELGCLGLNPESTMPRTPIKNNKTSPTPRHIIMKSAKHSDKENILKVTRQKKSLTYKGQPIRLA